MDAPAPEIEDTFAASLSKALEAINAHTAQVDTAESAAPAKTNFLAALDKLPPIKLPIGPAIPWKFGLPLLTGLVIVMAVMTRSSGEPQGVQLPAQQTYAVQQESPLFAKPDATPIAEQQQPPVGAPDSAAMNFDLMDIGIKLVAVLGLAYGSLVALKKFGFGGAGSSAKAGSDGIHVVSSVALAPNRSVHVLRLPSGKTLLVGATPTSVNLLSEMSDH